MRLEVMIGNSDPLIYPIKSSRVVIGSAETSDIVLPSNGISRKHLIVAVENDQYFVIDQGSTNGSYLNEERLVPGRRVEFTSFFPVRLGEDVLISLISDDEDIDSFSEISKPSIPLPQAQARSDHDATSVISLKQLKEVKTEKLIKRREEKRKTVKKKAAVKQPVKKKKSKLDMVSLVAIALVALAAYYNFFVMVPDEVAEAPVEVAVRPNPKPAPPKAEPSKLIAPSDLTSIEDLKSLYKTIKCVTDVEQYLCQIFTPVTGQFWGVSQIGTMSHVMLDVSPYVEEARKLITYPEPMDENLRPHYEKHTKEVIALYFLMTAVPETLDEEKLKDIKLTFSFYNVGQVEPEFYFALAIRPEALKEFKSKMEPKYLDAVRNPDNDIMNFARKHYTVY